MDNSLGKLISQLKSSGIYDSSLIIITSDHGELFGKNGFFAHRTPMYEGVVKIPLIIKLPHNSKTGRETGWVNLADIYPTVFSLCGLPVSSDVSAKAFGNSSESVVAEVYNTAIHNVGKHRTIYDKQYKFMKFEHSRPSELYNRDKDPTERNSLAGNLLETEQMMEQKLKAWDKTHKPKYDESKEETNEISDQARNALKALGYIQ